MAAVEVLRWKLRVLRINLSVLAISPILIFIAESVSSSCELPSKGSRRDGAGTKSSSTLEARRRQVKAVSCSCFSSSSALARVRSNRQTDKCKVMSDRLR